MDFPTLERRVRSVCDPVAAIRILGADQAPLRTDVKGGLQRVRAALNAGDGERAQRTTGELAAGCREETQPRRDLETVARHLQRDRQKIEAKYLAHFFRLVGRADYSNAVVCGEGLLEGNSGRCDLAPPDVGRSRTILLHRAKSPHDD